MTAAAQLRAAGMSADAVRSKEALFAAADAAHEVMARMPPRVNRFWVPGRIEVLGKHTDYAGGRSLLCAVERGFCVTCSARTDDRVRVANARSGEQVETSLAAGEPWAGGHWSNYVNTVVRRLARDFAPLAGADIAFASDLPIAAGVSSSSALVTALFLALAGVSGLRERPSFRAIVGDGDHLAGYLGAVENGLAFGDIAGDRGVGTFGGSEDHTAILRARVGALVQYRFCPVRHEGLAPLPADHTFLIAASGVIAEKTGDALDAYNRLSLLSRAALERWNGLAHRADRTLGDAIEENGEDVVRRLDDAAPDLAERAEQFRVECEIIIPAAADALRRGDLPTFGSLVARSMENAERMLHNQVPETMFLVRRARELGAVAASAFGAGFGGSVWALVASDRANALGDALRADYAAAFPAAAARAEVFATPAGPPAQTL